jgi:hypothetical protein
MADTFIEDFMGELNKTSVQNISSSGNNLDWSNTHNNDNYHMQHQDSVHYFEQSQQPTANYPFELNLIQNQGFAPTQHLMQTDNLNSYEIQRNFDTVQPDIQQNLYSFSSFNPEISNILNANSIEMLNLTSQQFNNVKREPKNLKDILKSYDMKPPTACNVFNFNNLTTDGGNATKKQKSRSINSIINQNNNNNIQHNLNSPTSLNQNLIINDQNTVRFLRNTNYFFLFI